MSNNTIEYWDIAGESLHQFGWSVTTFGGERYDLPPRRGENITLAYRAGQIHRNKQPDARVINLVMFLVGMDPATGAQTDDVRLRFNDSWDFLRRLVWKANGTQFKLTRRWVLTAPEFPDSSPDPDVLIHGSPGVPSAGVHLVTAVADAEMVGTMTPTMTGRHRADFTIELLLADPYFYGGQTTATVNVGGSTAVYNSGHDVASHNYMEVELIGPLTNPRLSNLTPEPDVWVQYNGTIPSGTTITLNTGTFTALNEATNTNMVGNISHKGARSWFGLQPGYNKLTLVADSGAGSALVRWRPPYV